MNTGGTGHITPQGRHSARQSVSTQGGFERGGSGLISTNHRPTEKEQWIGLPYIAQLRGTLANAGSQVIGGNSFEIGQKQSSQQSKKLSIIGRSHHQIYHAPPPLSPSSSSTQSSSSVNKLTDDTLSSSHTIISDGEVPTLTTTLSYEQLLQYPTRRRPFHPQHPNQHGDTTKDSLASQPGVGPGISKQSSQNITPSIHVKFRLSDRPPSASSSSSSSLASPSSKQGIHAGYQEPRRFSGLASARKEEERSQSRKDDHETGTTQRSRSASSKGGNTTTIGPDNGTTIVAAADADTTEGPPVVETEGGGKFVGARSKAFYDLSESVGELRRELGDDDEDEDENGHHGDTESNQRLNRDGVGDNEVEGRKSGDADAVDDDAFNLEGSDSTLVSSATTLTRKSMLDQEDLLPRDSNDQPSRTGLTAETLVLGSSHSSVVPGSRLEKTLTAEEAKKAMGQKVGVFVREVTKALQKRLADTITAVEREERSKLVKLRRRIRELLRWYHDNEGEIFDVCQRLCDADAVVAYLKHENAVMRKRLEKRLRLRRMKEERLFRKRTEMDAALEGAAEELGLDASLGGGRRRESQLKEGRKEEKGREEGVGQREEEEEKSDAGEDDNKVGRRGPDDTVDAVLDVAQGIERQRRKSLVNERIEGVEKERQREAERLKEGEAEIGLGVGGDGGGDEGGDGGEGGERHRGEVGDGRPATGVSTTSGVLGGGVGGLGVTGVNRQAASLRMQAIRYKAQLAIRVRESSDLRAQLVDKRALLRQTQLDLEQALIDERARIRVALEGLIDEAKDVQLSRVARQELLKEARQQTEQARTRRDKLQMQLDEMKAVEDDLNGLIQKKEADIREIAKKRGRLLRDTEVSMKTIEEDILGKCMRLAKQLEAIKPQFEIFRDALEDAFKCVVCRNVMVKPTTVMETGESCCEKCLGKYMKNTVIARVRAERMAYESELRKYKLNRGDKVESVRGIEMGDERINLPGYDNEEDDLAHLLAARRLRPPWSIGGGDKDEERNESTKEGEEQPQIDMREVLAEKKRKFLHEEWVALYMAQSPPVQSGTDTSSASPTAGTGSSSLPISASLAASLNKISAEHNVKVPVPSTLSNGRPFFEVYIPDFVRDPSVQVSMRLLDTYNKKLSMVILNSGVSGTIAKQLAINKKKK